MRKLRDLNEELDRFGMQGGASSDPQTAAPEAEKPWTTYYNDLLKKAQERKSTAQAVVDQNEVTKDDLDALKEDTSSRAVAGGLQSAANKFLSVGGEAPKSQLTDTFNNMTKSTTDNLTQRRTLADTAQKQVTQADGDIQLGFQKPFEFGKLENEKEDIDPNSSASVSARDFIKKSIGVDIPTNMSAAQLGKSSTMQPLITKWQADRAESQRKSDQDFQLNRERENQKFTAGQNNIARNATAAEHEKERTTKSAEHEKERSAKAATEKDKAALARELAAAKAGTVKAKFEALDPDKQETIKGLAKKNVEKTSIKNQIDGYLQQYRDATTESDRIRVGRQMIKVLNSPEGADAVGSEEVKRLAGALEVNLFNITGPGPMFGRDLPGFERQVEATSGAIDKGIHANKSIIDDTLGRTPAVDPKKPKAVKVYGKGDEIPDP